MANGPRRSLPKYCSPTYPLLRDVSIYFQTCIPTSLSAISTVLGALSIISWLFAQLPQIYKNHQLQSTAGLSIFFLAEWCLGDMTNLLGAIFTKQARWQVVVASYYVFVDVCLVFQYFWYTYFKPRYITGSSLHSGASSNHDDADSIAELSPINSTFGDEGTSYSRTSEDDKRPTSPAEPIKNFSLSEVKCHASNPISWKSQDILEDKMGSWSYAVSPSPRSILHIATLANLATKVAAVPAHTPETYHFPSAIHFLSTESLLKILGIVFSWCSTLLYLASRVPQLYKNWQLQSTAGLSPLLFFAAFCGNFFYSTSLLTNPNAWNDYPPHGGHGWADARGNTRLEWIARAMPFFLGAAGVLAMDGFMGVQFLLYGDQDEEVKLVKVRSWGPDGAVSHWERVNGWMRGWIPSVPGKERVVDLAESQRLLSESRQFDRRHRDTLRRDSYGAA